MSFRYDGCHKELRSLPLTALALEKLQKAGFRTVSDLSGVKPIALSHELDVSIKESTAILATLREASNEQRSAKGGHNEGGTSSSFPQSSSSGVVASKFASLGSCGPNYNSGVITFVKKLDELLRGGISEGQITELCGTPGVGKTQIAMQLAVNVTIPRNHSGQDGECIYIDTEGSLSAIRLNQMAEALHGHLCKIARHSSLKPAERKNLSEEAQKEKLKRQMRDKLSSAQALTADAILGKIAVFDKAREYEELVEVLEALPKYIESTKPRTKLLIIDSVAMPLRVHSARSSYSGHATTKNTARVAKALAALASYTTPNGHGLHIVTTNHMVVSRQGNVSTIAGYPMHQGRVNQHRHGQDVDVREASGQGKENTFVYSTYHDSPHFKMAPALGDTWSSTVNKRLLLFWSKSGVRQAALSRDYLPRFAQSHKFPCVPFSVLPQGVRDTPKRPDATDTTTTTSSSSSNGSGLAGREGLDLEIHMAPHATHRLPNDDSVSLPFEYAESPQLIDDPLPGEAELAIRDEATHEAVALGEEVPSQHAPVTSLEPPLALASRDPANVYGAASWTSSPNSKNTGTRADAASYPSQTSARKRSAQEVYGNMLAQDNMAQRKRTN